MSEIKTRKTKRIVLTGASGFLGQHLLHFFLTCPAKDCNYHIYALYWSAEGFPEAVQAVQPVDGVSVEVESLDLSSEDDVKAWMEKHSEIDVCIHTAALSSPRACQEKAERAMAINAPSTFLLSLLSKKNTAIIALSTDQVYDGSNPPYVEQVKPEPCNVYGHSKRRMEEMLQMIDTDRVVLLRSSIILGPKAPISPEIAHTTFLHFIASRQDQDTEFYSDERRSVIAVSDVIATIQYFVDSNESGVFNMGGPESISRFDMAKAVFEHLGYDTKHLIAKEKADLPPSDVPSPLDITMDSSKLHSLFRRSFLSLDDIVKATFSST